MPGHLHETIIRLLKEAPELMRDLLPRAGVEVPSYDRIETGDPSLAAEMPVALLADAVHLLRAADRTVFAIVSEVQNEPDDEKEWSLPVYWSLTRRRNRCPTLVLVIATSDRAAEAARRIIAAGDPHPWSPRVLGPDLMPLVTDQRVARDAPYLGVLSALVHGNSREVVLAVLRGLSGTSLAEKELEYYYDLILAKADKSVARAVEVAFMRPDNYEYQSDFARRYFGQGKQEGRQEGQQEGLLQGARRILLTVVRQRRLRLSAKQKAQIEACTELELLERWAAHAAVASKASEIFLDV